MSLKNTEKTYGVVHVALHWISALAVFGLFASGLWIQTLNYYSSWYRVAPEVHKSVGFVLVLLMIFRLVWRHIGGSPTAMATHKAWEKISAKLVHIFFYLAIVLMFVSGYFITTAKGQPLEVLGIIAIPATITSSDSLQYLAEDAHKWSAYTIIAVAVLHALAALKHHFIDRDKTLVRMFGR